MDNLTAPLQLSSDAGTAWLDTFSSNISLHLDRFEKLAKKHVTLFGAQSVLAFSTPGRTEIAGNHTDHQQGRVLAAAIDLDVVAIASKRDDGKVVIHSDGYEKAFEVDLSVLEAQDGEKETSLALIRGIASRLKALGFEVGGFSACMQSLVLKGSGISSSAAFEVLVCDMFSALYNQSKVDAVTRARISQFAENHFFGKPSGLMDQTACSVGGMVALDFSKPDLDLTSLYVDFAGLGFDVMVVDTRGSHDNLTDAYAAIPVEMSKVAAFFGKTVLREVERDEVIKHIGALREVVGDRAILRALHFFDDDARVGDEVAALLKGDIETFFRLVIASGESSYRLLQNIYAGEREQGLALALELSRRMLEGKGAWRVHGGGFAGTMLAFVPHALCDAYCAEMEAVFGEGCVTTLRVRAAGATHFSG